MEENDKCRGKADTGRDESCAGSGRSNTGSGFSHRSNDDLREGGPSDTSGTLHDGPVEAGFEDGTQSLDLSGLFNKHVNVTGSFQARGIGTTVLGKVLEALPIPAFLIDDRARITFANQACRRIHKNYEKILGEFFYGLFPDAGEAEKVRTLMASVFSTRQPRCLTAMPAIGTGRIWGRVTLRSVRIGRDRFLLALVEDLTAEKGRLLVQQECNKRLKEEMGLRDLAEKTRRQSELRFELAMKGADLAWWDWDLQTGALVCDRSFSEMLGYGPEEIPPQKGSWEQLISPEDAGRFSEAIKAHLDAVTPNLEVEHRALSKKGAWKWVLTRGRIVERSEDGRPLRVSGTNLDITSVKEARERIIALTHTMIMSQERERERIASDLNDHVAQDLSALRLSLKTVADDLRSVKPELSDRVEEISETVRSVVEGVRCLSYELLPPGLDHLGLVSTVQQYCSEFSAKNRLSVKLVSDGVEGLQPDFDVEINLFRVIQEALNNTAEHAQARSVVVRISGSQSRILVRVKDDGKGFDVLRESAEAIAHKRLGLWSIRQRIDLLQGTVDITSDPDRGTEIVVDVPLEKHL
ncbi:MAG: PAS domain-containing protein [Pseudomonadota bacterium]